MAAILREMDLYILFYVTLFVVYVIYSIVSAVIINELMTLCKFFDVHFCDIQLLLEFLAFAYPMYHSSCDLYLYL